MKKKPYIPLRMRALNLSSHRHLMVGSIVETDATNGNASFVYGGGGFEDAH